MSTDTNVSEILDDYETPAIYSTKPVEQPGRNTRAVEFCEPIADEICILLESGESIFQIAGRSQMPTVSTMLKWSKKNPEFKVAFESAQDLFWQLKMMSVYEEMVTPIKNLAKSTGELSRRKAVWDATKLMASKFSPRFSEAKRSAQMINIAGDGSATVKSIDYSRALEQDNELE